MDEAKILMKENTKENEKQKGFAFCFVGSRQKFLDQNLEWHTGLRESTKIFHPKEVVYLLIAHFQILRKNKILTEPSPTWVYGVYKNGDTLQFPGDKFLYDDFVKLMRKK